ncbi:MAG: tRNA (N(6)-L-threonylcarbamoyladenosine(37)-C(2))-methylthiotransferase MtaB [Candidatus Omnitrophota bacterium]|nr:tRNA (N(6)-L-threonylcarbamoyladenosine(37)-C(2))-methylthiotransferase MtaB [Candidatus Omnitrophota bacterium]
MNVKTDMNRRFFIKTLGCKVNQYESQAIRELLINAGFRECLAKETADLYILNTCTVTHKADSESRHWAGMFHKTNPKAKIILTGCAVEKNAGAFSFLPGVSNIIKNDDKINIADILTNHESRLRPYGPIGPEGTADEKPHRFLSISDFKDHTKAFVKIQDGCAGACSYCKVPYVRGSSISRPLHDIVEEVTTLVSKGFEEIVLTGICLGAWGGDLAQMASIVDVLKALCGIPGTFRIRLSSIEPKYVTDELIDYMSQNRKICKHLHIPIQSGDDEVLSRMNRPYTADYIRGLAAGIKRKIAGVGITTDVLIGFPGEADVNFRNTLNLIKEILPVKTHIFPFSKRDGTAASAMTDIVPEYEIKKRFQSMKIAAITVSYLYREGFLKQLVDVLVESKREKHSGRLTGYSDNYIKVIFDGPDSIMGKIVSVRIEELNLSYTLGSYVELDKIPYKGLLKKSVFQ